VPQWLVCGLYYCEFNCTVCMIGLRPAHALESSQFFLMKSVL
jgi:hypothetical protein